MLLLRYVDPDPVFAQELSKHRMFEDGRADLCRASTEDFSSLGYGLALYFQFLKMLIGCFVLVFVLTLPLLVFCLSGDALGESFDSGGLLTRTTLGNVASGIDCDDNSSLVNLLLDSAMSSNGTSANDNGGNGTDDTECDERVGYFFGFSLAMSDVMFLVAALDAVSSLVILLSSFQFHVRLASFRKQVRACVRACVRE